MQGGYCGVACRARADSCAGWTVGPGRDPGLTPNRGDAMDGELILADPGTRISYTLAGEGERTLVFAHGSYLDRRCWDSQVRFFSPDFRVLTFDLPGHGKSNGSREDWTFASYARDVAGLVAELELTRVILVGHSMSAYINLILMGDHRLDAEAVIAIDAFKSAGRALPDEQREMVLQAVRTDYVGATRNFAETSLLSATTPVHIREEVLTAYERSQPALGQGLMEEMLNAHRLEQLYLPRVDYPLFVVNVDYAPTDRAAFRELAGGDIPVCEIGGTCHFPMLEVPDKLNRAILECTDATSSA
jgi:sigma-B regulation protein RsbQ